MEDEEEGGDEGRNAKFRTSPLRGLDIHETDTVRLDAVPVDVRLVPRDVDTRWLCTLGELVGEIAKRGREDGG